MADKDDQEKISVKDAAAEKTVREATEDYVGRYAVTPLRIEEGPKNEPCAFCNSAELTEARGVESSDYHLYAGDWLSDHDVDQMQDSVPICATCLSKKRIVDHPGELAYMLADEETKELMDGNLPDDREGNEVPEDIVDPFEERISSFERAKEQLGEKEREIVEEMEESLEDK